MAQKPVLVFVHGAWHTNEAFGATQAYLSDAGYSSKNLQLASSSPDGPYVQGIDEDVKIIQNVLNEAAEEGKDIILIMHSYGGLVGSSAAKGFWKKDREAKGQKGGIVHLVYIAALVADEGVNLKSAVGGELPPWLTVHGEDTYMTTVPDQAYDTFYNDLSKEEAQKWISKLNRQATKSFEGSATYAAWKHIPSTYMLCGQDHAVPAEAQEMLLTQEGANFNVVRFPDVSHSPFLSVPKETADVIRRAAGEEF